MPVLMIRDENGNFVPIPALKGADGKSAYEQAKDGGFQGTEEEFIAILGGLLNPVSTIGDEPTHADDKNNPHGVTAQQVGAVPEVYYVSSDLNTELRQGGNKFVVCCYNSATLNSPYKEGLTVFAHGMVITNAHTAQYGTQLCMPTGDNHIYIRRLNGQGISAWAQVADMSEVNSLFGNVNSSIGTLTSQMGELQTNLAGVAAQGTKIASGQYTGTGTFGESNKNTLTFPFVPKGVVISTPSTVASGTANATYFAPATFVNGSNLGFVMQSTEDAERAYSIPLHLLWSDKTLSWYYVNPSTSSTGLTASNQLNYSGMVYNWVAIG